MRTSSSFLEMRKPGLKRDIGRFFSRRDNKVTKVPSIPLEKREREKGGERERD